MKKQKFLLIILGVILLPSCVTVKPSRGISVSGSFYKSEDKPIKENAIKKDSVFVKASDGAERESGKQPNKERKVNH